MNSVMNGKIRTQTPFTEVYIQPAADNGTALGAALYVRHQVLGQPRHFVMDYAAWGPAFEAVEIEAAIGVHAEALTAKGCTIQQIDEADQLWRWTAERLAVGQIVG